MVIVNEFADQISQKILTSEISRPVVVNGSQPYRKHYKPKNKDGNPVDIRKVTPKTNSNCTDCKFCVNICPMCSIDSEDVSKLNGICIKCGACIKKCPSHAKYFDDADYLIHKYDLEMEYSLRREPELFI